MLPDLDGDARPHPGARRAAVRPPRRPRCRRRAARRAERARPEAAARRRRRLVHGLPQRRRLDRRDVRQRRPRLRPLPRRGRARRAGRARPRDPRRHQARRRRGRPRHRRHGAAVVGEPVLVDGVEATSVDMGNPHAVLHAGAARGARPRPQGPQRRVRRGARAAATCGCGCTSAGSARRAPAAPAPARPSSPTCCARRSRAASRTTVDVPGGRLHVTWREDGHVLLAGPAVLLAAGSFSPRRRLSLGRCAVGVTPRRRPSAGCAGPVGKLGGAWMFDPAVAARGTALGLSTLVLVPLRPRRGARRRRRVRASSPPSASSRRRCRPRRGTAAGGPAGRRDRPRTTRWPAPPGARACSPTCRTPGGWPTCSARVDRRGRGSPGCRCSPAGARWPRPGRPGRRRAAWRSRCRSPASTAAARTSGRRRRGRRPAAGRGRPAATAPSNAEFFGWPEPYPDPERRRRRRWPAPRRAPTRSCAPAFAALTRRRARRAGAGPASAARLRSTRGRTSRGRQPGAPAPRVTLVGMTKPAHGVDQSMTSAVTPPARHHLRRRRRRCRPSLDDDLLGAARPRGRGLRPRAAPGRCAASPASAPTSRTSPRSSTASCASSASCSWASTGPARSAETSLAELQALAETAGCEVLEGLYQRRDKPDPKTYVGSGKAKELRDVVLSTGADTVILRRRAVPGPAARAGGPGQGQGHRPDLADPRHLRPARDLAGGQGAGRARADDLHAPAPARLGRVAVPPGRWRRRWRWRRWRRRRHPRSR